MDQTVESDDANGADQEPQSQQTTAADAVAELEAKLAAKDGDIETLTGRVKRLEQLLTQAEQNRLLALQQLGRYERIADALAISVPVVNDNLQQWRQAAQNR